MKKHFLVMAVAALLFSCSSPMEKKYSEETIKGDIEALQSKLDTADLQLLAGSMMRLKFQGEKLEEMTYGEILENGKNWKAEQDKIEAEQKALAEKAAKEEAERIRKLTEAVMVSCIEKGYNEADYQKHITYKFVVQNKSDKNIRAVKGDITFTDLFDEEIQSLSFVYDHPIEAGKQADWEASTEYNQFIDEDKALKSKGLKDLKVVWKPEKIIFEDNTTLE